MVAKPSLEIVALARRFVDIEMGGNAPTLSDFARAHNVTRQTLYSAIERVKTGKWDSIVAPTPPDIPIPQKKPPLTSEERSILKDTKSALNEARRERDEALARAAELADMRSLIGGMQNTPVEPPKWLLEPMKKSKGLAHVPMTIWSDWHAGEVVSLAETNGTNEFNSKVMERRARVLVNKTIDLCMMHGPGNYPGIVVNLLGDFISGALHPELAKTDDKSSIEAALHVRDVLAWGLEEIAKAFGQVYVPCTSGNHGRNTHKPEFKRTVFQNFDWLIYEMLRRHFEKNKRIIFDNPDSNEVHYKVFGRRYLAMHGDMLGTKGGDGIIGSIGPISRGELKVGRQASAFGKDYDCLLLGHWHQSLWLPRVIVANSLKGFDEYAAKSLRAPPSIPSQPLWFVNQKYGQVVHCEVFLEEQPQTEHSSSWVTLQQKKAA